MVSTYGILFMGTPHQGSEGDTWEPLVQNMASIFANINSKILKHLAKNSEWLEYQQKLFLPISNQFETVYFYETYPTPLPAGGALLVCSSKDIFPRILLGYELTILLQVVPKHSACIPGAAGAATIAISSDHTNMVKFKSAEDDGFKKVSGELIIMLRKAPQMIGEKWKELRVDKHSGG